MITWGLDRNSVQVKVWRQSGGATYTRTYTSPDHIPLATRCGRRWLTSGTKVCVVFCFFDLQRPAPVCSEVWEAGFSCGLKSIWIYILSLFIHSYFSSYFISFAFLFLQCKPLGGRKKKTKKNTTTITLCSNCGQSMTWLHFNGPLFIAQQPLKVTKHCKQLKCKWSVYVNINSIIAVKTILFNIF